MPEHLAYGEIEYRGTVTRNGLLGVVAFLNTTSVDNEDAGKKLFADFAPAAGFGLRVLLNKHSRTNLTRGLRVGQSRIPRPLPRDPGSVPAASSSRSSESSRRRSVLRSILRQ